MAKLYVTNLIIIHPSDLGTAKGIRNYKTEQILVEKTLFGYREVFTKHPLKVKKVLEKNLGYRYDEYPNVVIDPEVHRGLEDGEIQFVLDERKCCFSKAEEIDAKKIVSNFEMSSLNRYYKQKKEKKENEEQERKRVINSRKKAKQLVKTKQNERKNR